MKVASDEVFGPVVAVQEYETLDEAIALANGTRYGLQAAIFTGNIQNAFRATRELDFGGVMVNESPTWRADIMPYGGVKDSGNTKEGPAYAIQSMTQEKLIVINV
jgi:acyl-CoA reductase-like NAD-dependent aldehyde dehydrogenase